MSTVIVPGRAEQAPHPVGKLANALFSIAIASFADPARLSRGRAYAADGSVQRIELEPGTLVATVQGGQPNAYRVIVSVATIATPDLSGFDGLRRNVSHLTPDGDDFTTSCSCPDWDAPCKHAVATLVAFAHELIARPELLVALRCSDHRPGRVEVGARAKGPARHLRLAASNTDRVVPPAPVSPWQRPEWQAFLGAAPPAAPDLPVERAKVGRAMLGSIDLGEWLGSALDQFTNEP